MDAPEPGLIVEPDLQARVASLERLLRLLLQDEAIGNVLKGPLRVPLAAIPAAIARVIALHNEDHQARHLRGGADELTGPIRLKPHATRPGLVLQGNTVGFGDYVAYLIPPGTLTADRVITLPDATGEVALDSELYFDADAVAAVETAGLAKQEVYIPFGNEPEAGVTIFPS